ncbi:YeeE/YedE family protein [Marinigracilibium pacificum]|uniref:YeeE/YedE family protein n=1 Tax=Marinigracilibium pacificum TaxID=2729599 RepID=A0A848J253_9BACT|nr:YeeE/YedE thiosulfate transporter family protein [Marinigracilibium pacificum]NMM49866.1 YeeE/YedE family protein [Marinigracilibium pacificum]
MNELIDFIKQPWPWYVAGPLIGLTVPTLLILGNKSFGISSSLRHACAACFPANIPFFKYNWKKEMWNIFFVIGILIGGFIAASFLQNPEEISIAESTRADLSAFGITDYSSLLPAQIFTWENLFTGTGLVFFVIGGFMVGFGTRYAGGCTSGHAIMGLSNLQLPSLIATIFFMVGGIVSTHFLLPVIFKFFF